MSPAAKSTNNVINSDLFLIIDSSGFMFSIEKYAPRQKKRIVCGIKSQRLKNKV